LPALCYFSLRQKLIQDFGNLETALEKNQAFKTVRAAFPVKQEEDIKNEEVHLKLRLLLNAKQMILENYPLPLGKSCITVHAPSVGETGKFD
jgi:hypothetical protein